MKLHFWAIPLIILSTLSVANASDISIIQSRNEAAGFAGTMKFFVGRMARDCKPIISQNNDWVHSVVDKWMVRNDKYAIAAETWVSAIATYVAKEKGVDAGRAVAGSIMGEVEKNANLMVSDILFGSEENKKQICSEFETSIVEGNYDITEQAPLYKQLEELVAAVK